MIMNNGSRLTAELSLKKTYIIFAVSKPTVNLMHRVPFLHVALKGRPKIFQLITVSLLSFSLFVIIIGFMSNPDKPKNEKHPETVQAQIKQSTSHPAAASVAVKRQASRNQ